MIGKDVKLNIKVGGNFDPIPEGQYTLQIMDVELIRQMNKFKGEEQDMLNYRFAILNDVKEDISEGGQTLRGRYLWKRFSLSINKKSWLGKLIRAVYGRDLTDDETLKFHPDDLLNHQVDVLVTQVESETGNIYSNILSFSPAKKQLEPIQPQNVVGEVKESKSVATPTSSEKPPWE